MFNVGDKVTISRGKDRGEATIKAAAENGEYAVQTAAGNLRVVKAENLKAPQEAMVGEAELAEEIQTLIYDIQDEGVETEIQQFVQRLSGVAPGLGARLSWPQKVEGQ